MSASVASLVSSRISYIDGSATFPPSSLDRREVGPPVFFDLQEGNGGVRRDLRSDPEKGRSAGVLDLGDGGCEGQGAGHVAARHRAHDTLVRRDQDPVPAAPGHGGGGVLDRHVEVDGEGVGATGQGGQRHLARIEFPGHDLGHDVAAGYGAGQSAVGRAEGHRIFVVGGQVPGGIGDRIGGRQDVTDRAQHITDGLHGDLPGRWDGGSAPPCPPSRRAPGGRNGLGSGQADLPLRGSADEHMFVGMMERRYELESLRRSLAMLRPGAPALDREEAMRLVRELQEFEAQLRTLRAGLEALLAEPG